MHIKPNLLVLSKLGLLMKFIRLLINYILPGKILKSLYLIWFFIWIVLNLLLYLCYINHKIRVGIFDGILTLNLFGITTIIMFFIQFLMLKILSQSEYNFYYFYKTIMKLDFDNVSDLNIISSLFFMSFLYILFLSLPFTIPLIITMLFNLANLFNMIFIFAILIIFLLYIALFGTYAFTSSIIFMYFNMTLIKAVLILIFGFPLIFWMTTLHPVYTYGGSENIISYLYPSYVFLSIENIQEIQNNINIYFYRYFFVIGTYILLITLLLLIDYFLLYKAFRNYMAQLKEIEKTVKPV